MGEASDPLVEKVVAAIAELQERAPDSIRLDSTFEELGIDSLNGFHLLCELEETLDVTIPDDDARALSSVRDVVDRIRPLVAARPS